jgi:hypothetical protein
MGLVVKLHSREPGFFFLFLPLLFFRAHGDLVPHSMEYFFIFCTIKKMLKFTLVFLKKYGNKNALVKNTRFCMSKFTTIDAMYKFCRVVVTVFVPIYLREPNKEDIPQILAQNATRGILGLCSNTSLACIGRGKIVYLFGNDCTRVILESVAWYLKHWKIMICGFGIIYSAWLDLIMTLTC